jgi:hypothetical protein
MKRTFRVVFENATREVITASGWVEATYKALEAADKYGTVLFQITETSK